MPRVFLLLAVLLAIVCAVLSMLRTLAELRLRPVFEGMEDEELEIPPEASLDDYQWIHDRLTSAYAAETEGWAVEMLARVDARLQVGVPEAERMQSVVLWIPEANAFTLPGKYIYVSRRILERAPCDDAVALLVAHEMAHHQLGHLASGVADALPSPLQGIAGDLIMAASRIHRGAEREEACDRHAFNLCLRAGYEPYGCLKLFDLLEAFALDHGDTESVFGSDRAIAAELEDRPEWQAELQRWWTELRRGHPSIRERKAGLLEAYQRAVAEEREAAARG